MQEVERYSATLRGLKYMSARKMTGSCEEDYTQRAGILGLRRSIFCRRVDRPGIAGPGKNGLDRLVIIFRVYPDSLGQERRQNVIMLFNVWGGHSHAWGRRRGDP